MSMIDIVPGVEMDADAGVAMEAYKEAALKDNNKETIDLFNNGKVLKMVRTGP